jgi:hypothetical protein
MPVITPEDVPAKATAGVPLVQIPPPADGSDSVVLAPAHIDIVPIMVEGVLLTVTIVRALQPVGKV